MFGQFKKIAKNSIIYGLGKVSSKLVGFVLLPIYTSHLSTEEYGVLGIIEITSQVLVGILGFRLMAALHRWYWDENYIDRRGSILFSILLFSAITVTALFAVFTVFSSKMSLLLFDTNNYSYLLNLMFLTILFEILFTTPTTLMKLEEKPFFYSLSYTGKLLVDLIFTIYFIVYQNRGINGIYEAKIIGFICFFLFSFRYLWKNIKLQFEMDILKNMLIFSFPLAVSSLSGVLLTIADRYSLKYLGTLSDVGIYSLGYKLANTIKIFIVSSIQLAIAPIIFKTMYSKGHKELYSKILTYLSILTMLFVLALSIFGKEIVETFAKDKSYWNAYTIIPIISFSIFFGMLKDGSTYGIYISKKTAGVPAYILGISILNLILNITLIPSFQIIGAAYATLISQAVLFMLLYIYSYKNYRINYELVKIMKIAIIGFSLIIVSSLFNTFSLGSRLVYKSALLLSYPLLLLIFGIFNKSELLKLKNLITIFKSS